MKKFGAVGLLSVLLLSGCQNGNYPAGFEVDKSRAVSPVVDFSYSRKIEDGTPAVFEVVKSQELSEELGSQVADFDYKVRNSKDVKAQEILDGNDGTSEEITEGTFSFTIFQKGKTNRRLTLSPSDARITIDGELGDAGYYGEVALNEDLSSDFHALIQKMTPIVNEAKKETEEIY